MHMKKTILFTLLALLGMTQAVAQEYEYVPFIREGVKWVFCYRNPFVEGALDMPEGIQYYSFEMDGEVLIGDKYYKPVRLTHFVDKNGYSKEVEDFIPVYLREENKIVYAIMPDGILHPKCPVGFFSFISPPNHDLPITTTNQEFKLYDFNDPTSLYGTSVYAEYVGANIETIGHHQCKCHHYNWAYDENSVIIEGIGYDGGAGFPLFYFEFFITGLQVTYGLSHVIEDGEIIYKGRWYDPDIHVGIDEAIADGTSRPADPNYYNLMGQPVGKDVPTSPGIYIHNGKKIVVR